MILNRYLMQGGFNMVELTFTWTTNKTLGSHLSLVNPINPGIRRVSRCHTLSTSGCFMYVLLKSPWYEVYYVVYLLYIYTTEAIFFPYMSTHVLSSSPINIRMYSQSWFEIGANQGVSCHSQASKTWKNYRSNDRLSWKLKAEIPRHGGGPGS